MSRVAKLLVVLFAVVGAASCDSSAPVGTARAGLIGLCVGLTQPSCCYASDCNDGDDCTADTCEGAVIDLVAGTCKHAPRPDPRCCNDASDCTAIPGCGMPACVPTGNPWKDCAVSAGGGDLCCNTASDCPVRACHAAATCSVNKCVYTATPMAPGCCSTAASCTAPNACQVASCEQSTCVFSAASASGCCEDVVDCQPNSCQVARCEAMQCAFDAKAEAGCCEVVQDCGSATACTHFACNENRCIATNLCDLGGDPPDLATVEALDAGVDGTVPAELGGGGGCSASGLDPSDGSALVLLLLTALRLRRRRGPP